MPMITPPKEQSVLPDGSPTYQSNAGASPEAFGGGIAAGLNQVAGASDQIAMRQFAVKNETDRVAAENELMARTQDLTNGNQQKGIVGYRTLEGQNAIDGLGDYQQKLQDAYKDVRSTLNPAAARQFDQTAFRIVRGASDSMGAYSSQQERVATNQTFRARVQLAQNAALNDADDPDAWAHHLGEIQDASTQASLAAGKVGDSAEVDRVADVGKVFVDRTKQLMARDPMEAADFYHANIGMVPPAQRWELEHALKTTTDGQYAHHDGQDAYTAAIGQPSAPSTPKDFGADFVKPIDDKRLASITSYVKGSTPYDDAIAQAAKVYGVNPNEIKLKIAIESGGNPKAASPAGAVGLGQFTEGTAKQYGITDRTDPVQSINGIAKMLAAHGGTVGSDMSKADRAYYGGNDNATGKNTDQYVENTRVARQALFGGGAPAPLTAADLEGKEGDVLKAAAAQAEQRRPGDAAYADQVKSAAHAHWAQDVQALKGKEYADFSQVLDATVKSRATQLTDLPSDVQQTVSRLSPQNLQGLHAQFDRNLRQANGEFTHSDPQLVNDLTQRIYKADGDPQKITNPGQLSEFMGKGLNYTDRERLTKEIADANNPEGSPFLKQTNTVKSTARDMLKSSMSAVAVAHPEMAEEAAYRFGIDLDNKIKAARAAKQDPAALLTPGSPNYVLDPSRVAGFMPTQSQIAARAANPTPAAAAAPKPAAPAPQLTAFASEAEATAAAAAGKLKSGDRIKIGNQTGTWH